MAKKAIIKQNIDGVYFSPSDNATYYVRQIGDIVWMNGLSDSGIGPNAGATFTNVIRGVRSGNLITAELVDVPRGKFLNNFTVTFIIEQPPGSQVRLRKIRGAGLLNVLTRFKAQGLSIKRKAKKRK